MMSNIFVKYEDMSLRLAIRFFSIFIEEEALKHNREAELFFENNIIKIVIVDRPNSFMSVERVVPIINIAMKTETENNYEFLCRIITKELITKLLNITGEK